MTADGETTASPPSRFGLLLYPGFQALDAFGGIDALNILSKRQKLTLSVLAADRAPVSTSMAAGGFGQAVVPTHTLQDAPADLEVLLIPGGIGTRQADNIAREIEFVRAAFPNLRHLLTVCTGTVLAAKAGVLEGHRATTNKLEFNWVTSFAPEVDWVPRARWVEDGKVWTSSGVTAGMDMMYAFIAHHWGEETSKDIADIAEYQRQMDPNDDPFARTWKVEN